MFLMRWTTRLLVAGALLLLTESVPTPAEAQSCGGNGQAPCTWARARQYGKVGCARGAFFDPRNGGECWSCPQGYKRTVFPVTGKQACERGYAASYSRAKYQRKIGCSRGFFDPISGGACRDRVLRGGSWESSPRCLRAANRQHYGPNETGDDFGLRVVRDLGGPGDPAVAGQ